LSPQNRIKPNVYAQTNVVDHGPPANVTTAFVFGDNDSSSIGQAAACLPFGAWSVIARPSDACP
jgi:hypothetical protein